MHALEMGRIHPTALIDEGARVGSNVTIGAYTIVHASVELGDYSVVGPHCVLGEPVVDFYQDRKHDNPVLRIGEHALIRSHSVLYAGSDIGARFECGNRVTIREANKLGHHVRVGVGSDIQDHCTIGNYTRLHSNVFAAPRSQIGDYVWLFPHSVLTNDLHPPSNSWRGVIIEDFAVISAMAVLLPGVRVGRDALVGASALVSSNVAKETVVVGNPARQVAHIRDLKDESGAQSYPWRHHFDRGMPWEGIGYARWTAKRSEGFPT